MNGNLLIQRMVEMFKDVIIASAVRTPIGKFGGSLKDISTLDLGTMVAKAAVSKAGIRPELIDEVVFGCVGQYGLNPFLARMIGIKAGFAIKSTGQTVNRLCASGLQAMVTAAMTVDHEDAQICVAGGAENMSNFPYSISGARWGLRMGDHQIKDDLVTALSEPFSEVSTHIAITAENIAARYNISREEADQFALESQRRAKAAIDAGVFKEEILPVPVKIKGENILFDTDEHPRDTSMEKLGKLKTIVKKDGIVTAGNASGINDAAAAVVIMNAKLAKKLKCNPLVKIVDYAVEGVDPNYMGMGPVASTKKLLQKCGIALDEIGLIELNEAFASQAIACIRELDLDPSIVNVNGSGISLGHPIGATGAVISVKLIYEMKRRNIRYGLAALCIGGGQGMSVIFENIN